jgi:hypothetical protein
MRPAPAGLPRRRELDLDRSANDLSHPSTDAQLVAPWVWALVSLACVPVAVVALAFLVLAVPMADDFERGSATDLVEYLRVQYEMWNGRWSGSGVAIALMSLLEPTRVYWAPLLLLACVHVAAARALLRTLVGSALSPRGLWLATFLLGVHYWASVPSPGSTLYWLSGGIENQLSLALATLLFAGMLRAPRSVARPLRVVGVIAACALAVFIPGLHELYGALLCIALAVATAIAIRVRHTRRLRWALVLSAALAGMAFVILAPGNELRLARTRADPIGLSQAVRLTAHYAYQNALPWMLDPRLIGLSLALVAHPRVRALRPGWVDWPGVPWRLVLPAATGACLLAGFFFPCWAMGGCPVGPWLVSTPSSSSAGHPVSSSGLARARRRRCCRRSPRARSRRPGCSSLHWPCSSPSTCARAPRTCWIAWAPGTGR